MAQAKRRQYKHKQYQTHLAVIFAVILSLFIIYKVLKIDIKKEYLSSDNILVDLYDMNYDKIMTIPRGISLDVYDKNYSYNNINYKKVLYKGKPYFIKSDNLTLEEKDIIKEDSLYVRTPVTIYNDYNSSKILGFIPKGENVIITGYDKINEGIVNMYQIKYKDEIGYIYSKYLVKTMDEANSNYNESGIFDIHKDRVYHKELYGGKTSNLDYYPYIKPKFENNILLEEARTLYLNGSQIVLDKIDEYIKLAKESNINAFVVDIKDGYLSYKLEIAKEYSVSAFNSSPRSIEEYKNIIEKLINNNFYVIGRIVAFNDPHFALDNKEEAISKNGITTSWTSAYSRKAWEYNVLLAKEAVNLFKFNEIQFDYVRFPEEAYSMSIDTSYDFKNKYNEEKSEAIQNFLFYATDEIHKLNTYISVDVFGECVNKYVTAYGQYWPAISNIVDVISAMPYPDHFNKYDYGFDVPVWTRPYELISFWATSAMERQKEIPTPALARTWIQAYDAIHEPKIPYDASKVEDQIKALYDKGLINGFITWNSKSNIEKYKEISKAFMKEYR